MRWDKESTLHPHFTLQVEYTKHVGFVYLVALNKIRGGEGRGLGEGVSGHCLIWASGMLTPKLRHILGCLAFSEKNSLKNLPYAGQITFWKYNGKSIFLLFKILTETFKTKFRIEIWTLSFQICLQNRFWTSGNGQTENTCIRVHVFFQFDHFPESKIDFESRFEKRMPIFLFYFIFEEFLLTFKKVKKWISHCIFKKWFDRHKVFFLTNSFSGKKNTPKYA